jgi:hypothetical protein
MPPDSPKCWIKQIQICGLETLIFPDFHIWSFISNNYCTEVLSCSKKKRKEKPQKPCKNSLEKLRHYLQTGTVNFDWWKSWFKSNVPVLDFVISVSNWGPYCLIIWPSKEEYPKHIKYPSRVNNHQCGKRCHNDREFRRDWTDDNFMIVSVKKKSIAEIGTQSNSTKFWQTSWNWTL